MAGRDSATILLGVDGGNSKTVALVAREDGTILGWGRSGCSDIYGAPSEEAALCAVDQAVSQALAASGAGGKRIAAGAFSLAGADWPEDFAFLRRALTARRFARRLVVVNDAIGGLRAGLEGDRGVSVICGTAAAVGARGPDGRQWHASWWLEPQGSWHLADKALRAVCRAELGIDSATELQRRLCGVFNLDSVEEVLKHLTARGTRRTVPRDRITTALLEEAEQGDQTAVNIVRDHGRALGDYALVASQKVGLWGAPFALVLGGGVLRFPGITLREAIVGRVREGAPEVQSVVAELQPAAGALFLAMDETGVAVDGAVRARVMESLPPSSVFATIGL